MNTQFFRQLRRDFLTLLFLLGIGGVCGILYNWNLLSKSFLPVAEDNSTSISPIPLGIKQISLVESKALFDRKSATFLDARRSFFYRQKRISGAETLPYTQFEQFWPAFEKKVQKGIPLILYCSGYDCDDSQLLAQKLKELGYLHLAVFHGGFPEWEQAGYPVESSLSPDPVQ